MDILPKIKSLAKQFLPEIRDIRHHLHEHPELSFKEFETAAFIEKQLKALKITFRKGVAGTGIIAEIKGKNPDSVCMALRADMDALPIEEKNNVPYRSVNKGVMHACGHDVHTSCLLGAAKILSQLTAEFSGTIRLIFQPGEERLPGGASLMIKEGALSNPKPASILGQHVMPLIPVGKVGFRKGIYMASTDEIYMTINGKGGHGAMPQSLIDPVSVTAQIIVSLQQIISRVNDPRTPSVLSFGKVIAEGSTNIIPDSVYIEGTFRTLNEEWREKAHKKIHEVAEGIAKSFGATCELRIEKGYPMLFNDEKLTERTRKKAEEYLGKDNVTDLDVWMAAEDFAYYSHQIPACFYRLGTGNPEKGITSLVHTPTFDIDEDALEIGMGLMAWLAVADCLRTDGF